jgi:hypothetical protein
MSPGPIYRFNGPMRRCKGPMYRFNPFMQGFESIPAPPPPGGRDNTGYSKKLSFLLVSGVLMQHSRYEVATFAARLASTHSRYSARGFARRVGGAVSGSSGHGCFG